VRTNGQGQLVSGAASTTHLKASLAQELIPRAERNLNNTSKLCHFFCGIVFYISDALDEDTLSKKREAERKGSTSK